MDAYVQARSVPLIDVLRHFGFTKWKSRKNGSEHYGGCPEHQPTKNKTSFSFTREKWNCFSCGWSGSGAIDMTMALGKIQFKQAIELLEKLAGAVHVEAVIAETKSEITENPPFKGTYHKFFQHSDWLEKRGLTQKTLDLFGVGLYNNPSRKSLYNGKILFPVKRFRDGQLVAYLGRTIDPASEDPKYLFPKGFHKQLEIFGAWQIKGKPHKVGYIVESPLCVMRYHQLGLPAVSPFGAHISEQQLETVRALFRGVIYLPDRDKYESVSDTVNRLASALWLKFPKLPEGINDPELLSESQIRALLLQ